MNYEEKYKQALERAMKLAIDGYLDAIAIDDIFPELKDNEDEQIRKWLIAQLELKSDAYNPRELELMILKSITWLKKQDKKEYVLKSSRDEDVRKFMQYIEKQAKAYEFDLPNRDYDIYAFAKDILHWLEKQGKSTITNIEIPFGAGDSELQEVSYYIPEGFYAEIKDDRVVIKKVERKFKVGDWVVRKDEEPFANGNHYARITNIDKEQYWLDSATWLEAKDIRLWTINDAKDGDVLVDSYSKDSIIILYKGIDKERSILAYCGWNGYILFVTSNDRLGYGELDNTNYLPATKEQCDLLFRKMKESDYEWNSEKKELKKIKVATKESEDKRIKKEIIDFLRLPHPQFVGERDQEKWITWIEKQGEQKQTWKPNAAQLIVIKDLIENENTSKVNKVVLQGMFDEFKQYFGLC